MTTPVHKQLIGALGQRTDRAELVLPILLRGLDRFKIDSPNLYRNTVQAICSVQRDNAAAFEAKGVFEMGANCQIQPVHYPIQLEAGKICIIKVEGENSPGFGSALRLEDAKGNAAPVLATHGSDWSSYLIARTDRTERHRIVCAQQAGEPAK